LTGIDAKLLKNILSIFSNFLKIILSKNAQLIEKKRRGRPRGYVKET